MRVKLRAADQHQIYDNYDDFNHDHSNDTDDNQEEPLQIIEATQPPPQASTTPCLPDRSHHHSDKHDHDDNDDDDAEDDYDDEQKVKPQCFLLQDMYGPAAVYSYEPTPSPG